MAGASGISPFPDKELLRVCRVFDCAGPEVSDSPVASASVLPSVRHNHVGAPESLIYQLNGGPTVCLRTEAPENLQKPRPGGSP